MFCDTSYITVPSAAGSTVVYWSRQHELSLPQITLPPLLRNRSGYNANLSASCILHLQLLSKSNHTASHRRCCYCDKFPALLQLSSQYISFVNVVFRIDWSGFIRPVHTIQCSCTLCVECVPKDFAWFKISFSHSNKYKIGGLFLVAHKCSNYSVFLF